MNSVISASLHSAQFLKERLALASSFNARSGQVTKFAPLNSKLLQPMPTWRASQRSDSSGSATETETSSVSDVEVTPYKVLEPPLPRDVVQASDPWITEEGEPSTYERLFSNLNEATFQHEPGSLTSAILLIAGTTVGAGILAIPAVTQEAGFLASSITCTLCWLYMVATGLLIAEVNVNTMCELGSGGVSMLSMAKRTLGRTGVSAACIAYLFIHYALLVAYTSRSSDILTSTLGIPQWLSAAIFSGAFGGLCYAGSQRIIGAVNGVLVVGIIGSFAVLVFAATGTLHWGTLLQANFTAVPQSIPIIALSFVYQNVVPVVCTNLEGDLPKIRSAVILGTAIPLMMFLVWDAVILGSLSGISAIGETKMTDPLMELRSSSGIVGPAIEVFSLLAITTSYIGFVLGLTDFLSDLLKLPTGRGRQFMPYLLSIFPPLVLALLNPEIFFKALDFAGTYGVLVLFGILPASMAWAERYAGVCLSPIFPPLVPGGKVVLITIIGAAGYVIISELISSLVFGT